MTTASPVVFRQEPARVKRIPLEWPVSFEGRDYDAISIRRMTVAEVASFVETIKTMAPDARFRFPMFIDETGAPIPNEVMDGLDDDDGRRVEEAAVDFLPQRFLVAPAQEATSPQQDGAPASSTSAV